MSSVGSYESSGEDFSEDYEVLNQESFSNTSIDFEDIQEAILGVKRTILETEVSSQARKDLVHKLIRLRIKKEDLENRKYFQVVRILCFPDFHLVSLVARRVGKSWSQFSSGRHQA